MQKNNPAHSGEVLKEYMGGAEVNAFSGRIDVDSTTLCRLLNGRAGISAPMALKLEAALGTSAEMWMYMQTVCDLWAARRERRRQKKTAVRGRALLSFHSLR